MQNWEEMHKVDPRESVQDTVYTCGPVQNDFLLKILPHKYTKALVKEKIKGKITSNWELKQRKLAEDFFFFKTLSIFYILLLSFIKHLCVTLSVLNSWFLRCSPG